MQHLDHHLHLISNDSQYQLCNIRSNLFMIITTLKMVCKIRIVSNWHPNLRVIRTSRKERITSHFRSFNSYLFLNANSNNKSINVSQSFQKAINTLDRRVHQSLATMLVQLHALRTIQSINRVGLIRSKKLLSEKSFRQWKQPL